MARAPCGESEWLGILGLAVLASAIADRQAYLRVAALVEPLRDDLVRIVVTGALRNATQGSNPGDTGAVARITHQAEIVRDSFAGLLMVAFSFAFTAASAIIGLVTLVPSVLPLAVVPMAASLALFCCLLPSFAAWQTRSVVGEEAVADSVATALAGLRDVIACGAEDQVRGGITDRVTAQATALRALARTNLLRTLCLAVGGWLPLILVLADAPSLVRHGVGPGAIIGAVTYIGGVLQGALYALSRGIGASSIRLAITLQRIVEASASPPPPGTAGHCGAAIWNDGARPDPPRRPYRHGALPTARARAEMAGTWLGSPSTGSVRLRPLAEPILQAIDLDTRPPTTSPSWARADWQVHPRRADRGPAPAADPARFGSVVCR